MKRKLLEGLVLLIYYFWSKTLRIKIINDRRDLKQFYLFWHCKFFPLIYSHRKRNIGVLVSLHDDAGLLVKTLKKFGFKIARGSSTKGGIRGAILLKKIAEQGYPIGITPDGPVGPARVFKQTTFKLLKKLNLTPVFVGVACNRVIRVQSWDRFEIPLPFSKCIIYLERGNPQTLDEAQEMLENVNIKAERILYGG